MNETSAAFKVTRACAGECAWVLASVLVALVFVAAFVLMAEPVQASALGTELGSPVNLLRMAVLAAALWVWAYIARAIRGARLKPARRRYGRDDFPRAGSMIVTPRDY